MSPERGAFRHPRASPALPAIVLIAFCSITAVSAFAQGQPGRVTVTVTTLEGTIRMPGVQVELHAAADELTIAQTLTDATGQATFPDVPPGRYVVIADRPGWVRSTSAEFEVRDGDVAHVLVDIALTFAAPPVEVTAGAPSPTSSVQPVSMSDMLAGTVLESAPIEGDDFESLLPLLPGVVRGTDGRLRIKGGQPGQGALQISSASMIDPSTGDFDLDLPGPSIESVEVLANPFAAEYGRFSTSLTQIRTRRGTNDWEIAPGNLIPRFRKGLSGIRGFEPRFSVRGPLRRDRLFLAQDNQFRYLSTPVRSLSGEPGIDLTSFDSFTRIDSVLSPRHTLGGGMVAFPRRVTRASMNTFRPPETSPDFHQNGWSMGLVDRLALAPDVMLESTFAGRRFEVETNGTSLAPMVYAPQSQSGAYFNDHERHVSSLQWVEAISLARDWRGSHVFKGGIDLQRSRFDGESASRSVEIRRLDGSLAERIVFGSPSTQEVHGTEVGAFVQDRWRLASRLTFELGLRLDRDAVVEGWSWSPRGGVAVSVLPEGRAILRGGIGKFVQRTPLNLDAFTSFESRVATRYDAAGNAANPVALAHVMVQRLTTPRAIVGSIEWDQRFGRRLIFKTAFLLREGSHEFILSPDPGRGELRLSSSGTSQYKELEATGRYLGGGRRDLTASYVWSRGSADLNNYDQFFGNMRNPIVRANGYGPIPTDVRHRFLLRGTIGLPARWDVAPVLEIRSGFPWSAVDEYQDFVGPRNLAGRLPIVRSLDLAISRPWAFRRYQFRAGVRLYNIFGASAYRDVQSNVTAPDYGAFYNPIERSVGFTFSAIR